MLEIIIGVALGIIFGVLFLKLWRYILAVILIAFAYVLGFVIYIVTLPFKIIAKLISLPKYLFYTDVEANEKKLVSLYDKIFYKDESLKKAKFHYTLIDSLNQKTKLNNQKKQEKAIVKFLNKAKWVL